MKNITCPHCSRVLIGEHEMRIQCCLLCRRFGLLRGHWPTTQEEKNMTIQLTDAQIVRVLELCGRVAAIQNELPPTPRGMDGALESARSLRASLEKSNDLLVELGALLR